MTTITNQYRSLPVGTQQPNNQIKDVANLTQKKVATWDELVTEHRKDLVYEPSILDRLFAPVQPAPPRVPDYIINKQLKNKLNKKLKRVIQNINRLKSIRLQNEILSLADLKALGEVLRYSTIKNLDLTGSLRKITDKETVAKVKKMIGSIHDYEINYIWNMFSQPQYNSPAAKLGLIDQFFNPDFLYREKGVKISYTELNVLKEYLVFTKFAYPNFNNFFKYLEQTGKDRAMKTLFGILKSSQIETVVLQHNDLNHNHINTILTNIRQTKVRNLDLGNNDHTFGAIDFKGLYLSKIESLNLRDLYLSSESWRSLIYTLPQSTVYELDLSRIHMPDNVLRAFTEILPKTKLCVLNLHYICGGQEVNKGLYKELFKKLPETSLVHFDITSNELVEEDIQPLIDVIPYTYLRSVNFDCFTRPAPKEMLEQIKPALLRNVFKKNKTIHEYFNKDI